MTVLAKAPEAQSMTVSVDECNLDDNIILFNGALNDCTTLNNRKIVSARRMMVFIFLMDDLTSYW
jgi:hypothetical protein